MEFRCHRSVLHVLQPNLELLDVFEHEQIFFQVASALLNNAYIRGKAAQDSGGRQFNEAGIPAKSGANLADAQIISRKEERGNVLALARSMSGARTMWRVSCADFGEGDRPFRLLDHLFRQRDHSFRDRDH